MQVHGPECEGVGIMVLQSGAKEKVRAGGYDSATLSVCNMCFTEAGRSIQNSACSAQCPVQ